MHIVAVSAHFMLHVLASFARCVAGWYHTFGFLPPRFTRRIAFARGDLAGFFFVHARQVMPACSVQRWSLSLGRWWGVAVYLHWFFVLSALLGLAITLRDPDLVGAGLMLVGILLVSVTLHEVAHALAAVRVGG